MSLIAEIPLQGRQLIEASAGTGKTYSLTGLVLRLILEANLRLDQILLVSFTEATVSDLRAKTRKKLEEALAALRAATPPSDALLHPLWSQFHPDPQAQRRLELALRSFDEAKIFTIHGFCLNLLQEHAFSAGLPPRLTLVQEESALEREIQEDYWASRTADFPLLLARLFVALKLHPQKLQALAREVAPHAGIRLQPGITQPNPPDLSSLESALARLQQAWEAQGLGMLLFYAAEEGLNRNKFKEDAWAGYRANAKEILLTSDPFSLPDWLPKFTQGYLESAYKKGAAPRFHPLVSEITRFFAVLHPLYGQGQAFGRHFQREFLVYRQTELARRKAQEHQLGFNDLLTLLDQQLSSPQGPQLAEAARQQIQAALVDEFQDTDPVQLRIFNALFGDQRLILVGDPKQAIYSFRGADLASYLAARGQAQVFSLRENHRSRPQVVAAVNGLYAGHPNPFAAAGIHYPAVTAAQPEPSPDLGPGLVFHWVQPPQEGELWGRSQWQAALPGMVALAVEERLAQGDLASDLAVLVRSKRQAEAIALALRDRNIPVVSRIRANLFHSAEAREVWYILQALANPTQGKLVLAALSTRLMGCSSQEMFALRSEQSPLGTWMSLFQQWHQDWQQHGLGRAMQGWMLETDAKARLLAEQGGARAVTNLYHLLELLTQQESQSSPPGLLDWLVLQLQGDEEDVEENDLRLETSAAAVQIYTLHKSKGLEFKTVFLPYLSYAPQTSGNRAYHDDQGLVYPLDPTAEEKEQAQSEAFSEELRLAYVGLTRAQHRLVLFAGPLETMVKSPLYWLLLGEETQAPKGKAQEQHLARAALLRERMQTLARQYPESIQVRPAIPTPTPNPARMATAAPGHEPVQPRALPKLGIPLGLHSFTGLTRFRQPSSLSLWDERHEPSEPPSLAGLPETPITLAHLPKGPAMGNLLHDCLQQLDFQNPGGAATAELVQTQGSRYGLSDPAQLASIRQALQEVVQCPIWDEFCLAHLQPGQAWPEVEFLFPLQPGLGPGALAQAIAPFETAMGLPGFASEVEGLNFGVIQGFLKGFIDLVYEQGGKYHLLDYKTNHLGDDLTDYHPLAMAQSMREHHYALQGILYQWALHRLLKARLPGYAPQRHLGRVDYLFLKGMRPGATGGRFHLALPQELIRQLEALMGERWT